MCYLLQEIHDFLCMFVLGAIFKLFFYVNVLELCLCLTSFVESCAWHSIKKTTAL